MHHTVTIRDYTFVPSPLQIASGDTVSWLNQDAMRHSARRDEDPAFDTGLLRQNQESAAVRFTQDSGTELEYYCEPHPGMRGLIQIL
jgi:plastocyanin